MENNNEHITIEQLNAMEERLNKKIDDSSNSGCLFWIVIILLASIWGIETKIDNVQDQIKDTKTELYEQIDRIIPQSIYGHFWYAEGLHILENYQRLLFDPLATKYH